MSNRATEQDTAADSTTDSSEAAATIASDLIEEVSIDGMCGVY